MIELQPMVDALLTHASRTAAFDAIMSHEPRNAPNGKHTFACWLNDIRPVARASGLNVSSMRVEFLVRLFTPYVGPNAEELNAMDSDVAMRVSLLFGAYHGDFKITPADHDIDLLGAYGDPLRMQAGFAQYQNTPYRISDIYLPVLLWDVFDQSSTEGED